MANRGGRQPGDVEIGASNALQHHPQAHLAGPAHGAGHDHDHHQRRHPGDLEIGNTQVLLRHPTPHLAADHAPPVSERRLRWEAKRPLWLRECLAETTGVFCYTYSGVASTAALTLATAADEPAFGSLLTIGFAYGIGIAFALITSATTSGGHFNPAVTLCFATFNGFPWRKVPRYIIAQIFGGFLAVIFVYGQYHQQLGLLKEGLEAAGKPIISATGPAGIFVSIPTPGQKLGNVFINEFLADIFIGLIIIAVLDPTNNFMSPTVAPWAIGLAYTVMVWGFAPGTIATNTARDLGARLGAACFYGRGVLTTNKSYVAISSLTNIPATFIAWTYYKIVMEDSYKMIDHGHAMHPEVYKTLTAERDAQAARNPTDMNGKEGKAEAEIYHSNYASSQNGGHPKSM